MYKIEFSNTILENSNEKIIGILTTPIKELSKLLELKSLEKIIISGSFTEDVIKVQAEYGSSEVGHTNQKEARAIGKVLKSNKSGELKQTIIMSDQMFGGITNENYAQLAFHYLHHELAHIHDNAIKESIYTLEGKNGKNVNQLEHELICIADMIWSEYVATRLSAKSLVLVDDLDLPSNTLYISALFDLLAYYKKLMEQEIEKYRTNTDIDGLFYIVKEESSLVLKIMGTVLGYAHELKDLANNIRDTVEGGLDEFNCLKIWSSLDIELDRLFRIYPEWNDTYELLKLGEIVDEFWTIFGVKAEYLVDEDQLYVRVPF